MAAWERPDVFVRMKRQEGTTWAKKEKINPVFSLKKEEADEPISLVQLLHIGETYQHKGYASHFP